MNKNLPDDIKEILSKADHTLLSVTSTEEEIKKICDEGIEYGTASVCIPPSRVKLAKNYAGGKIKICTVIGFPNGYSTKEVKCFEAQKAIDDGADEIDMVINVGNVKERRYDLVLDEIKDMRKVCKGKILKVIIETCLLTDEEKIKMCEIVSESGADFIKTSTGFSKGGATFHDVKLMADNVKNIKIKAAGGIKTLDDAREFIRLGADRLGTSRIVRLVKELSEGSDNG